MRGKILAMVAGITVALGITVTPAPSATAATASDFNAGDIISDSLFYDASAMTSAQIQDFLDKKIGTCSSSDCINILRTSISSRSARVSDSTGNVVCKAFTGGTNLRVSEVIYRAQVACGISAKVILATLQKEQGLVTSKNPSDYNLNYAMGQACPDTAPCDPAFKGIGVQILAGATQLKTYKAAKFGRQPGTHNIQYSPTSSCGTKSVTIKNYGTAALYNYTPYTPNAAALSNLYGSGNSCSSYGNRNFWRDYTDWFGSTHSNSVTTIDKVSHLVALDASGEMWAYPTNGKGGWANRVSLGASAWSNVTQIIAPGDLDGDSHRDLITIDSAGKASLFRGNGALGYGPPAVIDVAWNDQSAIVAVGDFSGDDIPDVITRNAAAQLLLWSGTGSGGFRTPVVIGKGWGSMAIIAGVGDITGDGHPDVVARRTDGDLYLYSGDGAGGWRSSSRIGMRWQNITAIFGPGDFTGDGRADLIGKDSSGNLWLYAASGGKLANGQKIGTGWGGMHALSGGGPAAEGIRVFPAGAGDVNGDLRPDVLGISSTGELLLYKGDGSGGWKGSSVLSSGWPAKSRTFTVGDFSGDGLPDLGRITDDGRLWLIPGNGSGFGQPIQLGTGWSGMSLLVGGVDFDGDRNVDIIARDSAGDLRLYRGNGHGAWADTNSSVIGTRWNGIDMLFGAGDFHGNHTADLIARTSSGDLILYSTNGIGGWLSSKQIGARWGAMTALFSPGNFDGKGGTDVIARHSDGTLYLYRGDGKGGWSGSQVIGARWNGLRWIG